MFIQKWQPRPPSFGAWGPFEEVADLRKRMDEIFGEFFGQTPFAMAATEAVWSPLVDVHETKEGFLLQVELPGVKQEDIQVSMVGDTLTLKGERKRETEVKEDSYHRIERSYGTFHRSFTLPSTVDASRVSADYRNGVLTVKLPFREDAKPRTINVDVAA